jgi:hypothetical protein
MILLHPVIQVPVVSVQHLASHNPSNIFGIRGMLICMLRGLWDSLHEAKDKVENDHDHRLRRIEADLRWLTLLLGAEIVALISTAIVTIAGGG